MHTQATQNSLGPQSASRSHCVAQNFFAASWVSESSTQISVSETARQSLSPLHKIGDQLVEALQLTKEGFVAEATVDNVFLVRDAVNPLVAALLPVARKVAQEDGVSDPAVARLLASVRDADYRGRKADVELNYVMEGWSAFTDLTVTPEITTKVTTKIAANRTYDSAAAFPNPELEYLGGNTRARNPGVTPGNATTLTLTQPLDLPWRT